MNQKLLQEIIQRYSTDSYNLRSKELGAKEAYKNYLYAMQHGELPKQKLSKNNEGEYRGIRISNLQIKANAGEWSRSTSQELQAHSKDVLQPVKKDGTINKHFVQAHGTQSLEKELKMDRKDILDNVERYG